MMLCVEGMGQIFEVRLPIVIYTGHCFLSPAEFEKYVLAVMKIKGTSVSPTPSVDSMSVTTSSYWDISVYLCLPSPVGSVHSSIEEVQWRTTVIPTLRGVNTMLSICWLLHQ